MKIIRVPFQILALSLKYPGTFSEKAAAFRTLLSLKFKKLFSRKTNSECRQTILNYTVTGYDHETLHTLFYDIFLSPPYFFKSKNVNPVIVDCGSHIGMSVLYFKKMYPNATIFAIEANPHAYKLLQKNIQENALNGIITYNYALSNRKEKIPFYINDNSGTINGSIRKELGGNTELWVESMKLSEIISGIKEKIDLVKMDVEGSEHKIAEELAAASGISIPDQYIVEYHHKPKNDKAALAGFLKIFEDHGFEYNLWSRSQIDKCQDILIHFYKQV